MLNRILKYLGIAWMVIIFVFVPITYTALLFASDAEINMSVTIFFISTVFITSLWNIFKKYREYKVGLQLSKMFLAIYVTIFAFATLYQRAGILYGQEISFSPVDALYFSVVTWTTLGYGDFQPTESLRLLAAFQALLGTFFIPMLIAAVLFSLQLKSQKHSLQKNTNGSKP